MNNNPVRTVAVFGGSRVQPNSAEYAEAYAVGKLLAHAGYVVMNGGYAGTMEASARGAQENGGRAIGVLSGEFKSLAHNAYLDEMIAREDLFARIREMFHAADAFIVLKGSMGTLAELALVWNLAKIGGDLRKPIILLGAHWARVLESWRAHLAVTDDEAALLSLASKPEEVVELLSKTL